MVLLDSMRAERSPVSSLANRIRLFYRKDIGSGKDGPSGYLASLRAEEAAQVAAHGMRERPEDFLFDAVRDDAMAADLLAFYLEKEGRISTTYTFDCFLEAFGLEKEDALRLTHPFDRLSGNIAVVRAATRILGSGAAGRPDLIRVSAEAVPRRGLSQPIEEAAHALDVLSCPQGIDLRLADQAHPAGLPWAGLGRLLAEALVAAGQLGAIHDIEVGLEAAAQAGCALRIFSATPTGLRESIPCADRLLITLSEEEAAGLSEAAGASDGLSHAMLYRLGLGQAATARDQLSVDLSSGFGRGPFGTTPYGR
jgi:hypothetical protein